MINKEGIRIKESINGRLKELVTDEDFERAIINKLHLNEQPIKKQSTVKQSTVKESTEKQSMGEQDINKVKNRCIGSISQGFGHKPNRVNRHLFAAGMILCLFLVIIPVTVLGIVGFQRLAEFLNPNLVDSLQPVMLSSEDEGIKLEVLASVRDENNIVVFLTLQDLISDRIDNTAQLESYYIDKAVGFNCQLLNYDESSGIATFQLMGSGVDVLNGEKLSLKLMSVFSKRDKKELNLNFLFDSLMKDSAGETIALESSQTKGGGGALYQELVVDGTLKALKPDRINLSIPDLNFAVVSNMGYVDGRLHVQLKYTNAYARGYLYSTSKEGDIENDDYATYFIFEGENGETYSEFVFDLLEEDAANTAENVEINGRFVNPEAVINGNWEVAFEVNPMEQKQVQCDIDLEFVTLNSITVSPLGVAVRGTGKEISIKSVDVYEDHINLSIEEFIIPLNIIPPNISINHSIKQEGDVNTKYLHYTPLAVDKIDYVIINGVTVPLR